MPRASTSTSKSKQTNSQKTNPVQPRRSSRHANATQSQSQTQSQSDMIDDEPSWLNSQNQSQTQGTQNDSFLSISTASLPPKYQINLALPQNHKLSLKEENAFRTRGEEILSDAWRRNDDTHHEGKLDEWRNRTKRIVQIPSAGKVHHTKSNEVYQDDVLWYTAGIKFPCVCSLTKCKYAYSPCRPPPITSTLSLLPFIKDGNIAQDPKELPSWSTNDLETDLDPSMNSLEEFEISWKVPQESSSQLSNPDTVIEDLAERSIDENAELERDRRKWLKGKFKAIDEPLLSLVSPHPDGYSVKKVEKRIDIIIPPSEEDNLGKSRMDGQNLNTQVEERGWEEESKRRKSYWRNLIRNDEGYGKIWDFLPLPYTNPSRYLPKPPLPPGTKRKKTRIPSYQLPRSYHSLPHPFHPDLSRYIGSSPGSRVYWLIPLHGPVYIPYMNHPLTQDQYHGQVVPSKGRLVNDLPDSNPDRTKPFDITWTSKLMLNFLESFLHPLYMNDQRPFGILSYSFSGPKPDPFIDLPTSPPLVSHLGYNVGDQYMDKQDQNGGNGTHTVVKPESGDHLRIYCNLKYALGLRTWLHNIKIPLSMQNSNNASEDADARIDDRSGNNQNKSVNDKLGKHQTNNNENEHENEKEKRKGEEDRSIRIFYKTRLTLVGERGEVLIVA